MWKGTPPITIAGTDLTPAASAASIRAFFARLSVRFPHRSEQGPKFQQFNAQL